MMKFDELRETLDLAIQTKRLGAIRAVRLHAVCPSDDEASTLPRLAQLLGIAGQLWTATPRSVQLNRNPGDHHATLLAGYPEGQTAMISLAYGATGSEMLSLTVLGNVGSLRLEGGEVFNCETPPEDSGLLDLLRNADLFTED